MSVLIKSCADLYASAPDAERLIERAARVCYDSKPSQDVTERREFLRRLIKAGHLSPFEHASATFIVVCSRACAQQLTRHRHMSFTMQSQRYVTAEPVMAMAGSDIDRINNTADGGMLRDGLLASFVAYNRCIEVGMKREDARAVLPNAAATMLWVTANFRTWREFIEKRALNKHAQAEIRSIAKQVAIALCSVAPSCFEDLCNVEDV